MYVEHFRFHGPLFTPLSLAVIGVAGKDGLCPVKLFGEHAGGRLGLNGSNDETVEGGRKQPVMYAAHHHILENLTEK